jgi:hypothetical protein
VWQIAARQVRIGGKSWAANFETILANVEAGLGCGDAIVAAELYKLLVYDRGGFFLAHRDTEKSAGMFGTLVVTLPSTYHGGALRIRHAGREVTVDTSAADPSELSYVAFYADCEHEVLPVRAGNRVCLIYNLIQKPSKGKRRVLKAPEYESQIAEASAMLERCFTAAGAPAKIAWLFEHHYSPAAVSFRALKGADAARARVLVEAAARARCAAHLGIVHIGESGGAEPDYDYSYRSRRDRRRFHDYGYDDENDFDGDGDDDGDIDDDADFSVASVDDTWQYVDEWRDVDDRKVKFGRIPLAAGELLPAGALDKQPPDKQRLTEASGNEGATYERSYHRAAIVLWREDCSVDVLLQAGVVAALPHLKRLIAGGKRARPEAIAVAEKMLAAWPDDAKRWETYSMRRDWPEPDDRIQTLAALTKLKAPDLIARFLRDVAAASYDGSENDAVIAAAELLGDAQASAVLSQLFSAQMSKHPNECAQLLRAMGEIPSLRLPEVAQAAVEALDAVGAKRCEAEDVDWEPQERRQFVSKGLENLLCALPHFDSGALCRAAAQRIGKRPGVFKPVTLVVPALERLSAGRRKRPLALDGSIHYLWGSAAGFLLLRSEFPPQPPSDWHLDVEFSCRCADCCELQGFAHDPAARVHRFRVNKDRRGHLHRAIDSHRLDMTHETERIGSPQTLVCTKDRQSFERRMKQYGEEIAAMRALVRLAPEGEAVVSERMALAVKRASEI